MSLARIEDRMARHHLGVMGALHLGPDEMPGHATLVLLGPAGPEFWNHFTGCSEYRDDLPDPMDRWSTRVITGAARDLGGRALFPFGGPPWQPFLDWARRSGRAWPSPVGLLVHDVAGLMVSYRGAIAVPDRLDLPPDGVRPCDTCAGQPCLAACPVDALRPGAYDVPACRADLDRAGNDCRARGCAVRRACPVSQSHGRPEAQSAFHMGYFG